MHTHVNLDKHRWIFNITMTYKRSSDVPWEYGHCYAKNEKEVLTNNPKRNLAAGKKHLIGWFVTNCGAHSRRQRYVRELMNHIDVHKYGCGSKYSCPKSKKNLSDKMLNTTYKFYLSFENSLCEDYATEKTFRILALNVVTVIYVAIETEISDVWKQTTTFTFDWIVANWYQFVSASNLLISQNNESSWTLTNAHHIPERFEKPLKIGYSANVFGETWMYHKCLESCPKLKNTCVHTADRCQYNYAGVTFLTSHYRNNEPPNMKGGNALRVTH